MSVHCYNTRQSGCQDTYGYHSVPGTLPIPLPGLFLPPPPTDATSITPFFTRTKLYPSINCKYAFTQPKNANLLHSMYHTACKPPQWALSPLSKATLRPIGNLHTSPQNFLCLFVSPFSWRIMQYGHFQ